MRERGDEEGFGLSRLVSSWNNPISRTPSDNNATFLNESFACLTLSLCDTSRDLPGQKRLIAAGSAIQEL